MKDHELGSAHRELLRLDSGEVSGRNRSPDRCQRLCSANSSLAGDQSQEHSQNPRNHQKEGRFESATAAKARKVVPEFIVNHGSRVRANVDKGTDGNRTQVMKFDSFF